MASALDVMLMLDSSKLDSLRLYFMENEDKLPLQDFVTGVLRYIPPDKVLGASLRRCFVRWRHSFLTR